MNDWWWLLSFGIAFVVIAWGVANDGKPVRRCWLDRWLPERPEDPGSGG